MVDKKIKEDIDRTADSLIGEYLRGFYTSGIDNLLSGCLKIAAVMRCSISQDFNDACSDVASEDFEGLEELDCDTDDKIYILILVLLRYLKKRDEDLGFDDCKIESDESINETNYG